MVLKNKKLSRREFCKAGLVSLVSSGLNLSFQGGCSGKKDHTNIIIFLVDKLRPDHLGVYGYSRNTSPNIDRLSRQGIVFDNAYAPSSWTYPSVVSLLTGLVPYSHGATLKAKNSVIANPEIWLPVLFKEKGYRTVCFHTHPFLREDVSNIHRGFAEYHDPSEKKRGKRRFSEYMYLDTLYPACIKWLEKNYHKPFFMYIHVIDVHGPYNQMRVIDEDKELLRHLLKQKYAFLKTKGGLFGNSSPVPYPYKSLFYDGHINSVDTYFAKLFDKLQSLGIEKNTLLILTSDHGEGFGEHNCWNHGMNVYQHQIRIPLIFYAHKIIGRKPGRIQGIVNTVGLIPTLFDILGMNINVKKSIDGKSFSPLIKPGPNANEEWKYISFSDGCRKKNVKDPDAFMVDNNFKLISEKKTGERYLYDLKKDPFEISPITLNGKLSPQTGEIFRYLVKKRSDFLSAAVKREHTTRKLKNDSIKDLQALGYL